MDGFLNGEVGRGSFSELNKPVNETNISSTANITPQNSPTVETKKLSNIKKIPYESAVPADWPMIFRGLSTSGILHNTAMNCECVGRQGNRFNFVLDDARSTLYDVSHQQRLADVLSDYFAETISVQIALGKIAGETPAMIAERERQARQLEAEAAIEQDPIVQQLKNQMGASVRSGSIEPVIER